jgi:hypothetical protein
MQMCAEPEAPVRRAEIGCTNPTPSAAPPIGSLVVAVRAVLSARRGRIPRVPGREMWPVGWDGLMDGAKLGIGI